MAETGEALLRHHRLVARLPASTGRARHVTDATNASRTLLYDLRNRGWSEAMLELFEIPPQILPEVRSCAEIYGTTQGMDSLPDGIPVAGIAGDQQAASSARPASSAVRPVHLRHRGVPSHEHR